MWALAELSGSRALPAIAPWPGVVLQAHTEANSGQVQKNGPDNWLAGVWATPVGDGAATPSEDT